MSTLDMSGLSYPIITPFEKNEKRSIDFKKLSKLIDFGIEKQSIDTIVSLGTTGEATSLRHEEKLEVIDFTIKTVKGRVPVLIGTGSACTDDAIEMTRYAEKAGAAGILLVSPYYIRPNQEGLYTHFLKVAKSTGLPIVLYNHPGRTGASIEVNTLIRLANDAPNVIGVKDCPNSLSLTMDLTRRVHNEINHKFFALCGEDDYSFSFLCLGGDGIIAATSHVVGKELKDMMVAFRKGDLAKAREIQFSIVDIQRLMFAVPSPAPIKAALDLMGTDLGGPVRSPLVDAPKEVEAKIKAVLERMGKLA